MWNANESEIRWFCSDRLRLSPQLNVQHSNTNATKICSATVLHIYCATKSLLSPGSQEQQKFLQTRMYTWQLTTKK